MGTHAQDIFDLDFGFTPAPALVAEPHQFTTLPYQDDTPNFPALRNPLTPWPARLPFEIAMGGAPIEEIFLRNNITEAEYQQWATMPSFRRALSDAGKEVLDSGASWRVLCHGIAMDFLPTLDQKLHDPTVALTTKIDVLKKIVQWAGLEPKEEKTQNQNQNMVNIQINL